MVERGVRARIEAKVGGAWQQTRNAFVETTFPRRCASCGRRGGWVCDACELEAPQFNRPWCDRCGTPSTSRTCRCGELPDELSQFRALGPYEGWLRASILSLKYGEETARAAHLGDLLAPLMGTLSQWDWVVPVPLHDQRLRDRGFNQAELLARRLTPDRDRVVTALIRRMRATPQQVGLDASARRRNVAGAFAVINPGVISGKRIVLVDDVMTTGSTLQQCAIVLLEAGAARVSAVTLATGGLD
jgi:ComF family protein